MESFEETMDELLRNIGATQVSTRRRIKYYVNVRGKMSRDDLCNVEYDLYAYLHDRGIFDIELEFKRCYSSLAEKEENFI